MALIFARDKIWVRELHEYIRPGTFPTKHMYNLDGIPRYRGERMTRSCGMLLALSLGNNKRLTSG